jgi:hypothetical protein
MAITYSPQKDQEYASFKENGGTIVFEIDAEDISTSKDFENFGSIKPKLNTGFELPPTSLIESPELQALIATSGSVWDFIFTRVYLAGGNVVYKKQSNEKYQAECTVPAK